MIVRMDEVIWNPRFQKPTAAGFQEVWYVKFSDPEKQRALTLRFLVLTSHNGFKKIAETWAVHFQRTNDRDVQKLAIKQTYDITSFHSSIDVTGPVIKIADCELGTDRSTGKIMAKGQQISWDLKIERDHSPQVSLIPDIVKRHPKLFQNTILKTFENLKFSGTTEVNGEKQEWTAAPGMFAHFSGSRTGESWAWAHCNTFFDEQNRPVPFIFEGWEGRTRLLGPLKTPRVASFFFWYRDQEYHFHSLLDLFRNRSKYSLTNWDFQAERGDLLFKGRAKAEHKDFAGLTYEDTDGSLVYCAQSKLSDITISVYRKGKLEGTFNSGGTGAFEVADRKKNPYVPVLV